MQEPGKIIALKQIIKAGIRPPVLLFVSSKERAKSLHAELQFEGIHVDSIHADNCQSARAASVEKFRAGKTWLLVATDLIARGMDFLGVSTVINYDFPGSTTDYIHRCAADLYRDSISDMSMCANSSSAAGATDHLAPARSQ